VKEMSSGNDVYEKNVCVKVVFIVFGVVWGICFAAAGVLIINAQFYMSNCTPMGGPCTDVVVSDQFTSLSWVAMCIFSERIFFLFAFIALVGGYGRNKGCGVLWITIIILSWFLQATGFTMFLFNWFTCNKPGYPANICTDQLACLVPEFFNSAVNRCPNSPMGARNFTLSLTSLSPNPDFEWIFATQAFFTFVLELPILVMVMITWCSILDYKGIKL
jgi:hypothetical protein